MNFRGVCFIQCRGRRLIKEGLYISMICKKQIEINPFSIGCPGAWDSIRKKGFVYGSLLKDWEIRSPS
jgi:hypothetical protein